MERKKLASRMLSVIVVVGVLFGVYRQVNAQGDIANYLQERLTKEGVPVVEIAILQKIPVSLQISIQSTSDGEKAAPEDPINLNLVNREVILANRQGYFVERYAIVLLDNKGEPMARVEHTTELRDVFINTRSSSITDAEAVDILDNKINLYGMNFTSLDISSRNGIQSIDMRLSTPSVEMANQVLPQFMPSLRLMLEDVNKQGAQIAIFKLELRDESGNLLLNYILDLQLRTENWWMADNLTRDWFPHP